MAEYFVTPNVSHAPAAAAPISNVAPASNAAPLPAYQAPNMVAPAYAKPMHAHGYGAAMSPEAVLVLFILLVIITRLCR